MCGIVTVWSFQDAACFSLHTLQEETTFNDKEFESDGYSYDEEETFVSIFNSHCFSNLEKYACLLAGKWNSPPKAAGLSWHVAKLALLDPMPVQTKEDGADWAGDGYDDQENNIIFSNYFL